MAAADLVQAFTQKVNKLMADGNGKEGTLASGRVGVAAFPQEVVIGSCNCDQPQEIQSHGRLPLGLSE